MSKIKTQVKSSFLAFESSSKKWTAENSTCWWIPIQIRW